MDKTRAFFSIFTLVTRMKPELRQWHCVSIFINKFEQIDYLLIMLFFVEFQQVNVYLQKFDVWLLKPLNSFIVVG